MLGRETIWEAMHVDTALTDKMQSNIKQWFDIFERRPPWADGKTKLLHIAVSSSAYLSQLVNAEIKLEVSGSARGEYLNRQVQTYITPYLVEKTQLALVGGEVVAKPFAHGNDIAVEWVRADQFYPVLYDITGRATAAVFVEQITAHNAVYTRLEYHRLDSDRYHITNTAYKGNGYGLGREVPLKAVEQWAELLPYGYIDGVEKPLFACFRLPGANNIDGSKAPVSMYANAVGTLKEIDTVYSGYCWEFSSARRKVFANDLTFGTDINGLPPGLPNDLFVGVQAPEWNELFKDYTPSIREAEYQAGINQQLRIYEAQVGVTAGTFSLDVRTGAVTATQVISDDRKTFYTVSAIQRAERTALEDLIYAMDVWADVYSLAPKGKWEAAIEHGDSVFEDTGAEWTRLKAMVDAGYLAPEKLLEWYYGISEEAARKLIPPKQPEPFFG